MRGDLLERKLASTQRTMARNARVLIPIAGRGLVWGLLRHPQGQRTSLQLKQTVQVSHCQIGGLVN